MIPPRRALECWLSVLGLMLYATVAATALDAPRERMPLDFSWKFHLGDDWGTGENLMKAGAGSGPAKSAFSDTTWRAVNLPHDWVVELPFDSNSNLDHGFKPVGPGFPQNSVGWYRRTLTLSKADQGRRLCLEFDGIYRDCLVYLNGYLVGHHESGYGSFFYDITDLVNYDGNNSLAVRVDASKWEGWFYEGAGIYRHAWLVKTAPLALAHEGTFVYSEFKNNTPGGPAKIHIQTALSNSQQGPVTTKVKCRILGPDGGVVATTQQSTTLEPWSDKTVQQIIRVPSPLLWSPESPQLYKVVVSLEAKGEIVDQTETEFGIRTVAFDVNRGFLLNGQPYVIKGTCNHQDHAGVGSALPDRLQYFRIERLKEMGCNAYRTSHNPPTPELLEACDRLGMLVMDENRLLGSSAQNLELVSDLVRRDRNHASVFIWSIGNEEGYATTPIGGRLSETMQRAIHQLDPSRQVTYGGNVGNVFEGVNRIIDVRGWNYEMGPQMDDYHSAHPDQPNIGTEIASTFCTRGIYTIDKQRGYMTGYDDNSSGGGQTAERWWTFFAQRPWASGSFIWTGFDYRGEPTPYAWPCISSHFGVLDTCGFPKDNFYYYKSWWSDKIVLHLMPHWNWPGKEGQEIDVRALSNCDEVELFLNGESQGKQAMPRNSHLRWKVKYAPGTLLAKGFKAGNAVAEEKIETTGTPTALRLVPDRASIHADDRDLSIVTVAVTDAQGRPIPTATNLVHFELTGPGKILGVGNGDPSCHEADVYITKASARNVPLNDWLIKKVQDTKDRPEIAADFTDAEWSKVSLLPDAGQLNPGESAIYRTHLLASENDLASSKILLGFGMIDDDGWVYVNGRLVGESHDWMTSPSFDIRSFLHVGENVIVLIVKNGAGAGGVSKGVALDIQEKPVPADWKRSLFSGLAQVIVQSGHEAGEVHLRAYCDGLVEADVAVQIQPQAEAR